MKAHQERIIFNQPTIKLLRLLETQSVMDRDPPCIRKNDNFLNGMFLT